MPATFPPTIKFSKLKDRNPDYRGDFWRKCRALYAGGPTLLENQAILKACMPKHNAEEEGVYKERLSRAFYIPYAGSIIDKIVSELTGKPVIVEQAPTSEQIHSTGAITTEGDPNLPEFYEKFFADCSKPGGRKTSVNQLAREQILTALQCQYAWTLCDLPKSPTEGYANLAVQIESGGLNAYACPIAPENVIDWECDESGELVFVIIHELINRRAGITESRSMVTLRWRYYTAEEWAVYELTYDKTKNPEGPKDNMEAKLSEKGIHTFGRVPVRRMCLSDGLWAMGKLEAMARAHLNQRNALSWGQLKALFPVPVLFAGAPNPLDPITEDAGRINQRFGPGYMWALAEKDKLEYFSPDTAPYQIAADDLDRLRDEMHRVLHHMAMSVDNSGAALQRSAESKAIDQVAASVILKALGMIIREHLEDVYETVASGRGEKIGFAVKGMDTFEDTTVSQIVADAMIIQSLNIPSATFQKKHTLKTVRTILGPDATPQEIEDIGDELEDNLTQETYQAAGEADKLGHEARAKAAEREIKGEPPPGAAPKFGAPKPKAASKTKAKKVTKKKR